MAKVNIFLTKNKLVLLLVLVIGCVLGRITLSNTDTKIQRLNVSDNRRFLQCENGKPFFWLGDTGWLLFQKLSREEASTYLQDRCDKGFNVIQAMVIHELPKINFYGDSAFIGNDLSRPNMTPVHSYQDAVAYDYWDHVGYIVNLASEKGLYMALVPVWGSVVKSRSADTNRITLYISWLAQRFKEKRNIIWLNGGDIRGDLLPEIWQKIGQTLDTITPRDLITFHPFGRTQSSTWFHNSVWLDFNMFQSGHRRYDQMRDTDDPLTWKGEDNWKYAVEDYARKPVKPL